MSDTTAAGSKTAANEAVIEHLQKLIPPGATIHWIVRSRVETSEASELVLDAVVLEVYQAGRGATAMIRHVGREIAELLGLPWSRAESGLQVKAPSAVQAVSRLTTAAGTMLHTERLSSLSLRWQWL